MQIFCAEYNLCVQNNTIVLDIHSLSNMNTMFRFKKNTLFVLSSVHIYTYISHH